jgi:integrase
VIPVYNFVHICYLGTMRAKQGSVVLTARLPKEKSREGRDIYPFINVEIRKGYPVAVEGATMFYARYSDPSKKGKKNPTGRQVKALGPGLDKAWVACQNIELQMHAQRLGQVIVEPEPVKPGGKNKLTIAAAVAEFISYCESRIADWRNGAANGLSPNSFDAYEKAVKDFAASCAACNAIRLAEFEDEHRGEAILLHFKNWLNKNVKRRGGKAAYSDSRKFTVIGQFLARNGIKMKTDRSFNPNDSGLVDRVDVPRVKKPGIGEIVYYTPADIKAMLIAADSPDIKSSFLSDDLKDLLMVFLCTGMRDEEVQHLTWRDINWSNGDGKMKITVQDKPQYDWRVKDHEKRIVTPDKNGILKARLKARQENRGEGKTRSPRHGSDLIFPTHLGTPDQNFADRINALQKRAEKDKKPYIFSRPEARKKILHNFRKSYATYQMLQGAPPRNIQRDMGHYGLDTTERYLAIVDEPDKVRKEYAAL